MIMVAYEDNVAVKVIGEQWEVGTMFGQDMCYCWLEVLGVGHLHVSACISEHYKEMAVEMTTS